MRTLITRAQPVFVLHPLVLVCHYYSRTLVLHVSSVKSRVHSSMKHEQAQSHVGCIAAFERSTGSTTLLLVFPTSRLDLAPARSDQRPASRPGRWLNGSLQRLQTARRIYSREKREAGVCRDKCEVVQASCGAARITSEGEDSTSETADRELGDASELQVLKQALVGELRVHAVVCYRYTRSDVIEGRLVPDLQSAASGQWDMPAVLCMLDHRRGRSLQETARSFSRNCELGGPNKGNLHTYHPTSKSGRFCELLHIIPQHGSSARKKRVRSRSEGREGDGTVREKHELDTFREETRPSNGAESNLGLRCMAQWTNGYTSFVYTVAHHSIA